jgi:hypothetical protein
MESAANRIIKLRIYRKSIIRPHYYADARAIPVYVDDKHIGDLNPGYLIVVGITPGTHKIEIKAPGFLMAPVTKVFTVDEITTDVYVAFRGRLGKYVEPMIFDVCQYNATELSRETERTTQITFRSEDLSLKGNIWYAVAIDDQPVGTIDGNHLSLVSAIAKGKHKISFESLHEVDYACIDVKADCDSLYVPINKGKILDVQSNSANSQVRNRQVKCVLSRKSQFKGCAGTTNIIIDGNIRVDLKNGGTKEVFISEGRHSLMVKANSISTRDFVVPENCNKVSIFIEDVDQVRSIVTE